VRLLLLLFACQPDARVHLQIGPQVATVSDRFLSLAIDTAQVVGGNFWDPGGDTAPVPPFDFSRARLLQLAQPLGHAYLRIGGTDADRTWFGEGAPPAGYMWTLTQAQWTALANFATALDTPILFTLNAGPGPRVNNGPWQPDNARELLRFAAQQNSPVFGWELGNEVNAYPVIFGFTLAADDYKRDLDAARVLIQAEFPAPLAAPASAYWPIIGELGGLLPKVAANADVVTWHYYPQESARCPEVLRPATLTQLLDPDNLDEIDRWADDVDRAAAGRVVWLGETSNAQCGGAHGISDAFVSSLWWLDELGQEAKRGTQVVVRQSLTGADYGLLSEPDLTPRPDYFASVLWHRLMGPKVLSVKSPKPTLRAYAHCGDQLTVLLINLDETPITLALDDLGPLDLYVAGGALDSPSLTLNGVRLDDPSAIAPRSIADNTVALAGRSYAFAASHAACH
jgi:heparanase 1